LVLDEITGALIKTYTVSGDPYMAPIVAYGKVFVTSSNSLIYAFNETTGDIIWSWQWTPYQTAIDMSAADGKIFLATSHNRTLYAFNETNGQIIWKYEGEGLPNHAAPTIACGKVFATIGNTTYAFGSLIRDLAVTNVTSSKTVVGQGYSLNINVTIANQGDSIEAFNVTLYANTTEIGRREITLLSGTSESLTFIWNTSGFVKGNYTISAVASAVPGETDITDNNLTDGFVIVAMVGDIASIVNGKVMDLPDGKVDMTDIGKVAKRFGISPFHPLWDPDCDITGQIIGVPDNKIDMRDIGTVARNFGKIDP
jgi:hypothetical protein